VQFYWGRFELNVKDGLGSHMTKICYTFQKLNKNESASKSRFEREQYIIDNGVPSWEKRWLHLSVNAHLALSQRKE